MFYGRSAVLHHAQKQVFHIQLTMNITCQPCRFSLIQTFGTGVVSVHDEINWEFLKALLNLICQYLQSFKIIRLQYIHLLLLFDIFQDQDCPSIRPSSIFFVAGCSKHIACFLGNVWIGCQLTGIFLYLFREQVADGTWPSNLGKKINEFCDFSFTCSSMLMERHGWKNMNNPRDLTNYFKHQLLFVVLSIMCNFFLIFYFSWVKLAFNISRNC